jgi:membrane-bound metal-dependent hydrolase YbcI (DUF457 family)
MPQTGLHAALALATRKTFSKQRWFALGLTFGALTPDADSYPQAFAIILGKMDPLKAQEIFHRTLAHSLLFALAVGVGFYIVSLASGAPSLRKFGLGMATGIAALHVFVDIFAWFDAVGILWPLWSINLWAWLTPSELIKNIIRAGNFLAFAAYFAYLAVIARRAKTNTSYLPRLRLYTYAQLGFGAVLVVLAFLLSANTYNFPDGTVYLFLAYPNAIWVTWRMRESIEAA